MFFTLPGIKSPLCIGRKNPIVGREIIEVGNDDLAGNSSHFVEKRLEQIPKRSVDLPAGFSQRAAPDAAGMK